jgi:hypothetical protein
MRAIRRFSPALDSLPYRIVPSAYPPTATIPVQPSTSPVVYPGSGIDPNNPMPAPSPTPAPIGGPR